MLARLLSSRAPSCVRVLSTAVPTTSTSLPCVLSAGFLRGELLPPVRHVCGRLQTSSHHVAWTNGLCGRGGATLAVSGGAF
jgi:hypothetical protein